MQTPANNRRFLIDPSSCYEVVCVGLKGLTNKSIENFVYTLLKRDDLSLQFFNELTAKLIKVAEHAYTIRDYGARKVIAQILLNIPTECAQQAGMFYDAITRYRSGKIDQAVTSLLRCVETGPAFLRGRALQSLGYHWKQVGDAEECLRLQLEALHIGKDPLTSLKAHLQTAYIVFVNGDYREYLRHLESLIPLISLVSKTEPYYFYEYQNYLAPGYARLGRLEEARASINIALNSPYAHLYPEWHETLTEINSLPATPPPTVIAVCRPEYSRNADINQDSLVAVKSGIDSHRKKLQSLIIRLAILLGASSINLLRPILALLLQRAFGKTDARASIAFVKAPKLPAKPARLISKSGILTILAHSIEPRSPPSFMAS